jgi:hypothetical protein
LATTTKLILFYPRNTICEAEPTVTPLPLKPKARQILIALYVEACKLRYWPYLCHCAVIPP